MNFAVAFAFLIYQILHSILDHGLTRCFCRVHFSTKAFGSLKFIFRILWWSLIEPIFSFGKVSVNIFCSGLFSWIHRILAASEEASNLLHLSFLAFLVPLAERVFRRHCSNRGATKKCKKRALRRRSSTPPPELAKPWKAIGWRVGFYQHQIHQITPISFHGFYLHCSYNL